MTAPTEGHGGVEIVRIRLDGGGELVARGRCPGLCARGGREDDAERRQDENAVTRHAPSLVYCLQLRFDWFAPPLGQRDRPGGKRAIHDDRHERDDEERSRIGPSE